MPIINPPDAQACSTFIKQHKEEIVNGSYDIQVSPHGWIDELTGEELFFLFKYCPSSKIALASSNKVPPNGLSILSKDADDFVRAAVALNQNTLKQDLELLAMDFVSDVQTNVARNKNASARAFEILAKNTLKNQYNFVGYNLITNPRCPDNVLLLLAKHPDVGYRKSLARNRQNMDISPHILEILAKDLDPEVRRIVASVKNTPEYILDILAKDSNETVRERARKNPNYNGIMNKIKKYLS